MEVHLELFAGVVSDAINQAIKHVHIDTNDINVVAISILQEIRAVIQDEEIEDDFFVVEKIVEIFEKYNIDTGWRHDF